MVKEQRVRFTPLTQQTCVQRLPRRNARHSLRKRSVEDVLPRRRDATWNTNAIHDPRKWQRRPPCDSGAVMFVSGVLPAARARLVTLADSAALLEAASKLGTLGHDLVVVCGSDGALTGVVTKTNIVDQISQCQGRGCTTAVAMVMTHDAVVCQPGDRLDEVWSKMKARGLKNLPVLDENRRPLGVLNARDVLQALLQEVEDEESLLRDYVMNVGYR